MNGKNCKRKHQHENFFNEYEINSLKPLLARLGLSIEDLTRVELQRYLNVIHTLPHEHRGDACRTIAALIIAGQIVGTVLRYEIGVHAKDSAFTAAIARQINGHPEGKTFEEVRGLRRLLDEIELFSERGY